MLELPALGLPSESELFARRWIWLSDWDSGGEGEVPFVTVMVRLSDDPLDLPPLDLRLCDFVLSELRSDEEETVSIDFGARE